MSPLKGSNNIAARMGRWSASHWKTAVFGWVAFVVAAFYLGNVVGTKNIKDEDTNVGQSHKADQILTQNFPQIGPQTEIVLIQSPRHVATDPEFRRVINEVVAAVKGHHALKHLQSPLGARNRDQISKDGRTAMVTWDMKGEYDQAT